MVTVAIALATPRPRSARECAAAGTSDLGEPSTRMQIEGNLGRALIASGCGHVVSREVPRPR